MIKSLEDAKEGKFSLDLLDLVDLRAATRKIEDQARLQNRFLGINNVLDLQHTDTSYAYKLAENALYIINSIPLLSSSENMHLYSHVSIPVLTENGQIMRISTEDEFLAVSADETKSNTYQTMDHCSHFRSSYICPDSIVYKKGHKGCLQSIYFNEMENIQKFCDVK